MKNLRLFAALPLFAMGLCATVSAATNIVTPEQLFPQLDSILKQAVAQSPRMLSRALDLEMAENNRISARSGMLPSVSASASYIKSKDELSYVYENPANNSFSAYTLTKTPYAVTVSQPVYHWGALQNTARIGKIQQSIAQGQYREAYRLLAQTLRSEYLRLILVKQSALRSAYYLQMTVAQAKQDEERLLKKVISEAEIFSVRINLERAQIGAERANFELQNAVKSFAQLAGLGSEFTVDSIPDSIPTPTTNLESLHQSLAGFLSQKDPISTEAATMRQQLEVEELGYKIHKTRLLPKFNFSAGLSQDEQNNLYGSGLKYGVKSQYAGISVNWSIFDGFATRSAVSNALVRQRQLQNDYRQLTIRLAQDAQAQVKQAEFTAREMSIADRLLDSSEGNLRLKNEEFTRGVISEAAVGQAKLGLFDSQINAYNYRRTYLLGVGEFLGAIMEDPVLANLSDK